MAEKGETSKSPQKEDQNKEFERTLALIKPNAVTKSKSIQALIKKEGLLILKKRRTYLKPEQVRNFFLRSLDEEDNKYFRIYQEMMEAEASGSSKKNILPDIRVDNLEKTVENSNMEEYVDFMTGGPIELFILAGRGAISKWQELMGPEDPKMARILKPDSIRAKFGGENILRNAVYGSEDATKAEEEIRFFFPEVKSEADDKMKASGEYLSKTVNPILLKGLIQLCRQKPDNPLVWLADWLLANNPINEQS